MVLFSMLGAIASARAAFVDSYGSAIQGIPARVSWWRFGETSGTDAADEEGTQDGVYQGGVTLNQAPLPAETDNPDAALDGATGYIEVLHSESYTTLANGTIAIWFRPTSLTANATLVSKDLAGINLGDLIFWYVQSSDQLRLQIDDASQLHQVNATGVLSPNTTYCAVISWGSAGMKMFLASGGALRLIGTNPYTGGLDSNSQDLRIGATQFTGAPANFFPGTIGDVIIWNTQLSDAQIESVTQASLSAHEPKVTSLSPAVYLKFNEGAGSTFADSSGNGRSGSLNGTAAAYNVSALPSGTAAANGGLNLGNAAWISIPHAAADTALTMPSNWASELSTAGYRFIADCTVSVWVKPNSLPTGSNKHVIVARSSAETPGTGASYAETHPMAATSGSTVRGGSWEAYIDANGAVHVEVRSFRGRPCRIRTPDAAVAAGNTYHLVVQLSYDGVAAWLNGAKFEDGYANLLHVYGLCANIRNIVFVNNYDWTIGKAAWGGQADLIVDEFAIYLRAPSATISQANVNTLAQQGSTPAALAHHIWGRLSVNENTYAGTAGTTQRIQNAINDVNGSDGGTVLINPGTYTGNVTLRSNVRLKANGGTVTINGVVSTPTPTIQNLGVGTGDLLTGARTVNVTNSRSAGDICVVRGITNGVGGAATAMRHDRRWNNTGEGNDPDCSDGEHFVIESATGSSITFEGIGISYDITQANRQEILAFTPNKGIAIEGDIRIIQSGATTALNLWYTANFRGVGFTARSDGTLPFDEARYGIYHVMSDVRPQNPCTSGGAFSGFRVASCKDVVIKDCPMIDCARGFCDALGINANWVPTIRAEFHNITDISGQLPSPTVNPSKYGVHGASTDCIYWNITVQWGGYDVTGWKHDTRWTVNGVSQGTAQIRVNDGAGDCWYRDGWHQGPLDWFRAFEATVRMKRCHLRNIKWSAPPTTSHTKINYSTGAEANTYSNVDGPHASWTEV